MFKTKNYKEYSFPDLFKKEDLSLILHCMDELFEQYVFKPKKGTFTLVFQGYNTLTPSRIVSFDFEDGAQKSFLGTGKSSRIVGENVIENAPVNLDNNDSAIHYDYNSSYFMSLNTTYGRYKAIYYVDGGYYEDQIIIYCMIAKMMSLIMPGDAILQEAWKRTCEKEVNEYSYLNRLCSFVEMYHRKHAR